MRKLYLHAVTEHVIEKTMTTSLNSGTRETFKDVRGRDLFNKTIENLKNMVKPGEIWF